MLEDKKDTKNKCRINKLQSSPSELNNCSIKIAILNKTFEVGLIKEEKYQELKQNILQEYNLSHIGI